MTAGQKGRRNYAGIWAGNVVLEICGPYASEFQPGDVPARLHGLTFSPYETAEHSAAELDRCDIRHRLPFTWKRPDGDLKFVVFDDPEMTAPLFSISIMDVVNRNGEQSAYDAAHRRLLENHGGPLRLRNVREIQVTYSRPGSLEKWGRLLHIEGQHWQGNGGAGLRFVKAAESGIAGAVVQVESVAEAERFLRGLGLAPLRTQKRLESAAHGVRFVFTE